MAKNYHSELRNRPDLAIIAELVEPGFRVLDLGCGDGSFLKMLKNEHGAEVLGMEIDPDLLAESIANGVPVVQSDLDDELDFAEDNSFDLVILSQTLQQMRRPDQLMRKIVRVGKLAAVSFINFGFITCRMQLLTLGTMPRTNQIPYQWYNNHSGNSDRPLVSAADPLLAESLCGRVRFPARKEGARAPARRRSPARIGREPCRPEPQAPERGSRIRAEAPYERSGGGCGQERIGGWVGGVGLDGERVGAAGQFDGAALFLCAGLGLEPQQGTAVRRKEFEADRTGFRAEAEKVAAGCGDDQPSPVGEHSSAGDSARNQFPGAGFRQG